MRWAHILLLGRQSMSVTYRVERERSLIRLSVFGLLTDRDVRECVRAIITDPDVAPGMNVLADLRDLADSSVSRPGADNAILILREFGQILGRTKMVLVATGFGEPDIKLIQRVMKRFPTNVRLFPNLADAEEWLGLSAGG